MKKSKLDTKGEGKAKGESSNESEVDKKGEGKAKEGESSNESEVDSKDEDKATGESSEHPELVAGVKKLHLLN